MIYLINMMVFHGYVNNQRVCIYIYIIYQSINLSINLSIFLLWVIIIISITITTITIMGNITNSNNPQP